MMKSINKKIVTGTIAAAIILGGGVAGLKQSQVFAADTTDTSVQSRNQADSGNAASGNFGSRGHGDKRGGFGKHGEFGFRGSNPVEATATLLGMEHQALKDELQQSKSLAQVAQEKAGWDEEVYLQKLTDVITKSIDDRVTAGKLTQEQADKQKSGLADRLKQAIENKGAVRPGGQQGFHGKRGIGGPWGSPEELAQAIGITQDELKSGLDAGKSLAELAQEKNVSEDQLISKLKDGMTDKLKQFIESKGGMHRPQKDSQSVKQ